MPTGGKFEQADGGISLLDDDSGLSLAAPTKVHGPLEEGVVTRVGLEAGCEVEVRVVAATNKNWTRRSGRGTFREDLFYRMNVVPIELPPLRER